MKSQDKKQRLFEVMSRLDKTFKRTITESSEETRRTRARMKAESEGEGAVKRASDVWGMTPEHEMPLSHKEFMDFWMEAVEDGIYAITDDVSENYLHEQGDETAIEDVKTGRRLSIGDVVKAEGLSGEYQIGMRISEGRPFLMPFSLNSKRANPYHRIYITALHNPKLESVLSYSDTDGGFIGESKNDLTESPDDFFPITTPVGGEDDKLFVSVVNQGIDSHLEGFTKSKFEVKDTSIGKRRVLNFHKSELPILLRRLEELGTEEALQWKSDIENYDNNINEIAIPEGEKRIATTYQTVTPESAEQGDYADQGWEDEEGESMLPDEYEIEDGVTAVDKAVRFLLDKGGNEPSSSHFNTGVWYSTPDPDRNYRTGEEKYYSFHLKGFSPEEEAEIFNRIKTK